jgi:small subunit ribosomal protein S9
MAELVQYYGTGRRKSAIARVYLRPGSGDFKVNGRPFEQYFVTESQRSSARQPLLSTETAATFNVLARVSGGGVNGQADAVKLGIARALMLFNIELRKKLKAEGMFPVSDFETGNSRLETDFRVLNSSCASRCGAGMAIRSSLRVSAGCRPNEEVNWLTLP